MPLKMWKKICPQFELSGILANLDSFEHREENKTQKNSQSRLALGQWFLNINGILIAWECMLEKRICLSISICYSQGKKVFFERDWRNALFPQELSSLLGKVVPSPQKFRKIHLSAFFIRQHPANPNVGGTSLQNPWFRNHENAFFSHGKFTSHSHISLGKSSIHSAMMGCLISKSVKFQFGFTIPPNSSMYII